MKKIFFTFLFIVSGLVSCQPQHNDKIQVISAKEYAEEIKNEVQLVDVRTPQEYAQGKIKNAVNIDVTSSSFERSIQALDKSKPVYIYCRSGSRSRTAAQKMIELGFTQVIDLRGGYLSWKE